MKTPELDTVISEVRALEPGLRDRVTVAMAELVEQARADATFDKAMEDPAYRAYVEGALDEAEADRVAGRVRPAAAVFDDLLGAHQAKHGL